MTTFNLAAEVAKANADYFANAPGIVRECRCPAFPYAHEFGLSDCGDRMARLARECDIPESRMRIGIGVGSYGRPAIDDILDSPRRYEK